MSSIFSQAWTKVQAFESGHSGRNKYPDGYSRVDSLLQANAFKGMENSLIAFALWELAKKPAEDADKLAKAWQEGYHTPNARPKKGKDNGQTDTDTDIVCLSEESFWNDLRVTASRNNIPLSVIRNALMSGNSFTVEPDTIIPAGYRPELAVIKKNAAVYAKYAVFGSIILMKDETVTLRSSKKPDESLPFAVKLDWIDTDELDDEGDPIRVKSYILTANRKELDKALKLNK